jgi:hypothetical protein
MASAKICGVIPVGKHTDSNFCVAINKWACVSAPQSFQDIVKLSMRDLV